MVFLGSKHKNSRNLV